MTYRVFSTFMILAGVAWYAANIVYDSFFRKKRSKEGSDGTTEEEVDISQIVKDMFKPIDASENMQENENANDSSGRGHVVKMSFKTVSEMEALINKAIEEPDDEDVEAVIKAINMK